LTPSLAERLVDILEAARDLIDIAGAMDDGAFHALPNADRIAYRALKNALSELGENVAIIQVIRHEPTLSDPRTVAICGCPDSLPPARVPPEQ
jgi:uncharacterized protein with HEPN domain